MSNMINRQSGGLLVGSDTFTTYDGEVLVPYGPTDYGTDNLVVSSGGFGTTGDDLADDLVLAAIGVSYGDPMPPENNLHDTIETDALVDTKDWSRRLMLPNDVPDEALRQRYPTQITGGFPDVEPPV